MAERKNVGSTHSELATKSRNDLMKISQKNWTGFEKLSGLNYV